MKRVILAIVLTIGLAAPVWADFQAGLNAYNRGEYATALSEWKPLAAAGDVNAQMNLGNMYRKGEGVPKDFAEAAKWYRKAAKQNHAGAQTVLGVFHEYGTGVPHDYAKALAFYRKAAARGNKLAKKGVTRLEGDPNVAPVFFEKGLRYGRQNRHEEALKAFRKAASLQPNVATYHRHIGLSLAFMRRWREAIGAFQEAIKLQPELADAHHNLGATYANLGLMEEAKQAFEEAVRLNPNDLEARKKLTAIQRALKGRYHQDKTRFFPLKHNAKEKELFLAALKEGEGFRPLPDNPALNAEQKLAALYDGISALVQDYNVGYDALGVVLGRVGLWEEAFQAFLKAAKKKPNSAGTWGSLGVAGHVLGHYKQSANAFQKALKLEPRYFDTRPIQKKFAENSRKNRFVLQ